MIFVLWIYIVISIITIIINIIIPIYKREVFYSNQTDATYIGSKISHLRSNKPLLFYCILLLFAIIGGLSWPFELFYFIYSRRKLKKRKVNIPINTLITANKALYPIYEIQTIIGALLFTILILLSQFYDLFGPPLRLLSYLAIIYCTCILLSYLLIKDALWQKLKRSAVNIFLFKFLISFSILIIFLNAYTILNFGFSFDFIDYQTTIWNFLGINKIKLWVFDGLESLSKFDIFISLNGFLFSLTIIKSFKSFLKERRTDSDFIAISNTQMVLGNFLRAKKYLKNVNNKSTSLRQYALLELGLNNIDKSLLLMNDSFQLETGKAPDRDHIFFSLMSMISTIPINNVALNQLWSEFIKKPSKPYKFWLIASGLAEKTSIDLYDFIESEETLKYLEEQAKQNEYYEHLKSVLFKNNWTALYEKMKLLNEVELSDLNYKIFVMIAFFSSNIDFINPDNTFIKNEETFKLDIIKLVQRATKRLNVNLSLEELFSICITSSLTEAFIKYRFPDILETVKNFKNEINQIVEESNFSSRLKEFQNIQGVMNDMIFYSNDGIIVKKNLSLWDQPINEDSFHTFLCMRYPDNEIDFEKIDSMVSLLLNLKLNSVKELDTIISAHNNAILSYMKLKPAESDSIVLLALACHSEKVFNSIGEPSEEVNKIIQENKSWG